MRDLSRRLGVAMLIITHNLGVVARYADRVNVMYAGRIIERGTARELYANPRHPYTLGLLRSVPRLDEPRASASIRSRASRPTSRGCRPAAPSRRAARSASSAVSRRIPPLRDRQAAASTWRRAGRRNGPHDREPRRTGARRPRSATRARPDRQGDLPLLEVRNLVKHFPVGGGFLGRGAGLVRAVDGVSFAIRRGETLGLVGESGCGKTTTGRCILQLERPTSGPVLFEGRDLTTLDEVELRDMRRRMQVIFQDPYCSLNPRMTVGQIIAEPMAVHGIVREPAARAARVHDLLAGGAPAAARASRYPARAVRRPAPARRHRARPGDGADADRLRRAGVGARRVDPGADHQPAGGPAGASSA